MAGNFRRLFDHLLIRVADREASERFHETVLGPPSERTDAYTAWGAFRIAPATPERPPTSGLHTGFAAGSRSEVDAFWQRGIDAGYRDDGAPGERPQYTPDYYGGFLLDPDGNSAEAIHREGVRRDGTVDHLWIRVADLDAAARFYEELGARAGIEIANVHPGERVHFRQAEQRGGGSFALVAGGTPTTGLLLAFHGPERVTLTDPDGTIVQLGG